MTDQDELSPQDEAISSLSEIISELTSPARSLKLILRKAQHVCEILGWDSQKTWFQAELSGYSSEVSLPAHRIIPGKKKYQASRSTYDTMKWQSEEMVYGVNPDIFEEEDDVLEVRAGIDWFLAASRTGYTEQTDETKEVTSPSGKRRTTMARVRTFSAAEIAASLSEIEGRVYNFASKAYVQLKYGTAIADIWGEYRAKVEAALSQLDLTDHLQAIESGLQSTNPEIYRSAILGCRNLLNDIANHLWRDPRQRYEHLPGQTEDGKLDVSRGKFGNRIAAYLHQKGLTGTRGRYMRREADRLAESIQSLISFQSEAHEPLSRQDARSAAIATYVLVGELVSRTDLQPIEEYGQPSVED